VVNEANLETHETFMTKDDAINTTL
jgi:hypothetical protein